MNSRFTEKHKKILVAALSGLIFIFTLIHFPSLPDNIGMNGVSSMEIPKIAVVIFLFLLIAAYNAYLFFFRNEEVPIPPITIMLFIILTIAVAWMTFAG